MVCKSRSPCFVITTESTPGHATQDNLIAHYSDGKNYQTFYSALWKGSIINIFYILDVALQLIKWSTQIRMMI